jgi:drug/metabolite transporter, DME family
MRASWVPDGISSANRHGIGRARVTPAAVPALALASALISAFATILLRRGLRHDGPYTAVWVNLAVGIVFVWLAVALTGGFGHASLRSIAFFALAGLIGTVGGRIFRFKGIDLVGAAIAAAMINLSPLVSTALAIVVLGEHVTLPILTGTLVIVAGTTLLSSGGRSRGVRLRQLVIPLLSAVCFGVVAVLRKIGLADMGPVAGFAINVTAAFAAFTGFLLATGQRSAMACGRQSVGYFVAAGVAENLSVLLLVVALTAGSVSVVAPLSSVSPIFVLVLSFFFLRGIELLNARIVAGTVLVVAGVYLLTALR